MKSKKNLITVCLVVVLSVLAGLCASASFAYFTGSDQKDIPPLTVKYNK